MGEHGPALPGGAGEHDDPYPLRLKGAAGGGAPVVCKDGAALRQHGLLEVVLRHGPVGVEALEVAADALGRGLVKDQLPPEDLGQSLLGEVVAGGPQAAGGDEDVGPPPGDLHSGAEPGGIVPHHRVVVDVDAQLRKALGDHLGVCIGDIAEEQFGAHGDEFRDMRHMRFLLPGFPQIFLSRPPGPARCPPGPLLPDPPYPGAPRWPPHPPAGAGCGDGGA